MKKHFLLLLVLSLTLLASETNSTQALNENTFVEVLWELLNHTLFTINNTPLSAIKIVFSLIFFISGLYIGSFYKRAIHTYIQTKRSFNPSSKTILANLGYYVIILTAFFVALNILGINLSSIALIAGALSVGIGFGLQNIVSNFVSGIILMIERTIKIGDYIELSDKLRGHVTDIRMRSTTINTNSNIDVIVPNQDLIQKQVINWTMNDELRRYEIPFSVAYGSNAHEVIEVILDAVKKSEHNDIYEQTSHATQVFMVNMGESSLDFELHVWIIGQEIINQKRTTSRFLTLIYDTLNEHHIKIPFPQRDLHIITNTIEAKTHA